MTEISFIFIDGKKAKYRTMAPKALIVGHLSHLDPSVNFASLDTEDGKLVFVRLDQIRCFSVKEIAVV